MAASIQVTGDSARLDRRRECAESGGASRGPRGRSGFPSYGSQCQYGPALAVILAAGSNLRGGERMSYAGWRSNGKVEMDRRQFLAAAGMAGVSAAVVGLPRAEAQPTADVSGELVACVAGGAWETAFREHMAKPFSQKYPKVKLHLDLS